MSPSQPNPPALLSSSPNPSTPPVSFTVSSTQTTANDGGGVAEAAGSTRMEWLYGGNWLAWKTRITIALRRRGTYDIITGAAPFPSDPVEATDWTAKDLMAQELIVTTIDDEQIINIMGCNTSAEMWDALHVVHEPRKHPSTIALMRPLGTV